MPDITANARRWINAIDKTAIIDNQLVANYDAVALAYTVVNIMKNTYLCVSNPALSGITRKLKFNHYKTSCWKTIEL